MENKFNVVVQKFGGSSVAETDKIKQVAAFIKDKLASIDRICVVVSAMGNTTNDLIKLSKQVNNNPAKRELDMLISCGERTSMALLAMALHHEGVTAKSLTGSQSGIITDENHGSAQIIAIRPERVFEAFIDHQVVLVAGFQGMSRVKEITTLKRGGSDTTAVAMAAALKAKACEIYTDVRGVMEIDPSIESMAQIMPTITFDQMCAMSLYGAKIMAYDAARLAHNLGIEILIAKSGEQVSGTRVSEVPITKTCSRPVSAITHLRAVVQVELPLERCEEFDAQYFLCGHLKNNFLLAYGSNDIAQELVSDKVRLQGLGLITIHLNDQGSMASVMSSAAALLKEHSISLHDAILGFKQLALVISDDGMNKALSILYASLMSFGDE